MPNSCKRGVEIPVKRLIYAPFCLLMKIGDLVYHPEKGLLTITKKNYRRLGNRMVFFGKDENEIEHELDGTEESPEKYLKEKQKEEEKALKESQKLAEKEAKELEKQAKETEKEKKEEEGRQNEVKAVKEVISKIEMAKGNPGNDGYTPERGKDYWTDKDKEELVEEVWKKVIIPTPKDGVTPEAGIDYPSYQEVQTWVEDAVASIPRPKEVDLVKVADAVLKMVKIPEPIPGKTGNDGSPDSPSEIKEKLESLKGDERLDARALKNLPKPQIGGGGGPNSLKHLEDVTLSNPSNNQVLKYNSTTSKWENGTGGGSGAVATIVAGNNIDVDATDPANPIVSVETLTLADVSDVTASTAEVNVLDGIPATLTATELGYVDGVTSALQTQLNSKQASITSSDTQVLFSDGANNPAGDAGMTYNKTSNVLSVSSVYSQTDQVLNLRGIGNGVGVNVLGSDATSSGDSGGDFQLSAGSGNGTGSGGGSYLSAGNGGTTGNGGDVYLYGGDGGNSGARNGGNINIIPGTKNGAGTEGRVKINDPSTGINAVFDTDSLATSDKIFTFPNTTGTLALTSDLPDNLTDFVSQTAWRVFYANGSGDVTELALGADGTFLKSNGASAAPTFATPAGSGNVSKVGTPVDGQVAFWTGDGTIAGDADFTYNSTDNAITVDTVSVLDDTYSAGDWNGSLEVPTKNAIRDKIESMSAGSGITRTVVVSSGNFTAGSTASTDYVYFIAGAHTASMPAAAGNTNRYTFKNNHSAAVTVTRAGTDTINANSNGLTSITVNPFESVDLISNGTDTWSAI